MHNIAVDGRGNIFTTKVDTGKRARHFRLMTPLPRQPASPSCASASGRCIGENSPTGEDPTVRTLAVYLLKVAHLGGCLARTRDPPPGNTVMWRGRSRLADIMAGAELAERRCG